MKDFPKDSYIATEDSDHTVPQQALVNLADTRRWSLSYSLESDVLILAFLVLLYLCNVRPPMRLYGDVDWRVVMWCQIIESMLRSTIQDNRAARYAV